MFRPRLRRTSANLLAAFALLLGGESAAAHEAPIALTAEPAVAPLPLALMGTIPVYWGEVDGGFEALIEGEIHPHWARAQLEEDYALWPLDYLTDEALAPFALLMMAQPRGLTAQENLALDNWVRNGGRLLLLADPAMTGHSHYPLGDRRRPQDTALLSPILAHWGLELLFDVDQPEELATREFVGSGVSASIPVILPGRFAQRNTPADCSLYAIETIALCHIGAGRAVILADAAMLDHDGPWPGAQDALHTLRDVAFGSPPGTLEKPANQPDGLIQPSESNREIRRYAATAEGHADPP